jgi:hypothetical protein
MPKQEDIIMPMFPFPYSLRKLSHIEDIVEGTTDVTPNHLWSKDQTPQTIGQETKR